jgi:predicted RNA-binding protein with PUA-like domain
VCCGERYASHADKWLDGDQAAHQNAAMRSSSDPQIVWLAKSEPDTYSYDDLVREGRTSWNGVRNPEARKHLRSMKVKDRLFFYHSGKKPAIVGIAEVVKEAYPEAGAEDWSVVDVVPVRALRRPVTLAEMKELRELQDFVLVRRGRLSVMPVSGRESATIMALEKAGDAARS